MTNDHHRGDAEEALRQSEELFRTVFERAPDDVIIVTDAARRVLAWNPAAERVCGWSATEAMQGLADVIFVPEEREAGIPEQEAEAAARTGRVPNERWHVRKDGVLFWGSGTMNALYHPDGSVRGFMKVFRDATERRAAEIERDRLSEELRIERERLVTLVKDAPSFVAVLEGADLTFTYCNDAYYRLVGHRDIIGMPLLEALPEVTGQGFFEILSRVRDTGEPFFVDERPVMLQPEPGGPLEERFVALAYHPGYAPDGTISGVLAHGVDVTEQVRSRQAIARMNEVLEAAVADRTAELQAAVKEAEGFNYSIAHDLRAPLRAILSTSGILLEDLGPELDREHRGLLERQSENAKRLGRLIDELLRLSRFSRAEVVRKTLDMTAKARSVFADLQDAGRTSGCRLEVQDGMTAEGDEGLVRTVLHNLIGNACKFSPHGGTVSVRQEGNVFSVSDEGVGFDMAFAPKLFLPFERLVSETEYEGTGIGLANVERIVRRHGGDVWAESELGKGATFFFTLEPSP